ncbi:MAG: IS1182 family transposase [Burkholderiales bacterium]|nr:IS1182 family transposase [Burkholderiales bacterium]
MTDSADDLFKGQDLPSGPPAAAVAMPAAAPAVAAARVLRPERRQIQMRASDLESLLQPGHRARLVWSWVERQDLSTMYAGIKAVQGGVGRAAIAPEILLALWLYAMLEGVGSARQLARITDSHDAYRWLCGGVQVNHHSLSDFRVEHGQALDELLSVSVASLMAAGAVKLKQVAHDGIRVRASAGAGSFRRQDKLEGSLEQARARVAQLKDQMQSDGAAGSRRGQAAQRRAAQERQARLEQALRRLPEVQAIKERQGKAAQPARVSTTDAEATVMKMGDGGFRPAYNPQLATDADSLVIVGVDVATVGSDQGQMVPMLEQVTERCGQAPAAWLVDGGFTSHEQIEQAARSTEVYGPVPQPKTTGVDPHQPKAGDSEAVAQWRVRMGTDEAKAIYRRRAATAECVNAQARNRGLQQFLVRGVKKVTCVMLLFALAHNLMRMVALAPDLLAHGTGASAATAMAG